jgi:integrase
MTIRDKLYRVAVEKGLRQTTVISYERLLGRIGILDLEEPIFADDLYERLWKIENPNTRRAAVIACRSVLGVKLRIPKGIPRRYNLPDETTLRLALMTSPHEVRGLLMMYGGLRIGEACATTAPDVTDDQLSVTKQVTQIHQKGKETIIRIAPVKTIEGTVTIPWFLVERVKDLTDIAKPDSVRESLRRAGQKVGINLNPHMLRHWYVTTALARGMGINAVSKQVRHSDIAVTLRTYQQTDASDVHRIFGES